MNFSFQYICLLIAIINIKTIDIYMATDGNDNSGNGSIEKPYKSLMKCQEIANSGDKVIIRGGIYKDFPISSSDNIYNYIFQFKKSGITYKGKENEKVIFDFEFNSKYKKYDNKPTKRITAFYIPKKVKDIIFENIECTRVPVLTYDEVSSLGGKLLTQSECFRSYGENIVFNRVNAYNNQGIGFYFLGTNNIAYRCDSYNNVGFDQASLGNADGFGAHGMGAKFIECRAWDNSDDNYN